METLVSVVAYLVSSFNTDPTYKEWKPFSRSNTVTQSKTVHGSYLQGMETLNIGNVLFANGVHGSYLQGMETSVNFSFVFNYLVHGSYLQGMETNDAPPI